MADEKKEGGEMGLGRTITPESDDAKALFKNVRWVPLRRPEPGESDGMPYATHGGILQLPGCPGVRVYQLNTGQRLIDEADFAAFFGLSPESESL